MDQINIITSLFHPRNNANAFVITRKSIELSKKFLVKVFTLENGENDEMYINNKNLNVHYCRSLLEFLKMQMIKDTSKILISYHHEYFTAYFALINKIFFKKKWIAILSDPSRDISPFGSNERKLSLLIFSKIPMLIISKFSDCIIFNDHYQYEYISQFYKIKNYFINQMGYSNRITQNDDDYCECIEFVYLGDLYGPRNGIELFSTLNLNYKYFEKEKCKFIFYGDYEIKPDQYYDRYPNISKIVEFHDRIDSVQAIDRMKKATVLLVIDANLTHITNIYPYTPSKIIDYLGTDKPIFGISMSNSPTHDLCIDSNNWWANFDEDSILVNLRDCILNYRKYKRNNSFCDNFSVQETNKELVTVIKRYL